MNDKWQNIFKNKKTENLISCLIILIITLVVINLILKDNSKMVEENETNTAVLASNVKSGDLSIDLENVLKKIRGVGNVSVLITYSENEVKGAVVIADGASNQEIKGNIISAVEVATGLATHKIQVFEMNK